MALRLPGNCAWAAKSISVLAIVSRGFGSPERVTERHITHAFAQRPCSLPCERTPQAQLVTSRQLTPTPQPADVARFMDNIRTLGRALPETWAMSFCNVVSSV